MTGTYCIDIILLHHSQVFAQFLLRDAPAVYRTEFMAVSTFEHNPFSIQRHNAVFHLKSAEPGLFRNNFTQAAVSIVYLDRQVIQFRFLCTP